MKVVKAKGSDSGAYGAISVTPSDTQEINNVQGHSVRWLMTGTDGDVSVVFEDGSEILLRNLISGVMYPLHIKQIKSTSTTATNIVAMF